MKILSFLGGVLVAIAELLPGKLIYWLLGISGTFWGVCFLMGILEEMDLAETAYIVISVLVVVFGALAVAKTFSGSKEWQHHMEVLDRLSDDE